MTQITETKDVNYPYLNKPLKIFKTDKGHTIIFAHKDGEMINISTWVKTGSIHENDVNNGVSHFVEHLMFKGTSKHKAGEFDKILEANGAIINAATGKDYTYYYVTIPKGENDKNIDLAIELHADMMVDPIFPDNELGPKFDINNPKVTEQKERCVVIQEIGRYNDKPWSKTYHYTNDKLYSDHPYKRDVIGTKEIISQISRDSVMDYYRTWYTPNNMTTIVVGDFDYEKVLNLIISEFKFKDLVPAVEPTLPQIAKLNNAVITENKGQVDTGYAIVAFHGTKASDNKGTILLDIISMILAEGMSSRMYQTLIENKVKSVFNVIDSGQYTLRDGNVFMIDANFDPKYKDEAISELKECIIDFQNSDISEEELKKAKNKLAVKFAESAETVSDIGENIGYYMSVCDGLEPCENYMDVLNSVTVEDVKKAAKEFLDLNKCVISLLMPEE